MFFLFYNWEIFVFLSGDSSSLAKIDYVTWILNEFSTYIYPSMFAFFYLFVPDIITGFIAKWTKAVKSFKKDELEKHNASLSISSDERNQFYEDLDGLNNDMQTLQSSLKNVIASRHAVGSVDNYLNLSQQTLNSTFKRIIFISSVREKYFSIARITKK